MDTTPILICQICICQFIIHTSWHCTFVDLGIFSCTPEILVKSIRLSTAASSLIWGYISYNRINIPLFQSNMTYLDSMCVLCCIILSFGKQPIAFQDGYFCSPCSPTRKAGGVLAPLYLILIGVPAKEIQ